MNLDKSVELTHIEKQVILYTKGHFKRIDYKSDLKYFAAKTYGFYPEQVDKRNLFHMIVTLYQKLIDTGYIKFDLKDYLSRLFKNALMYYDDKDNISYENVLCSMLAEIQGTSIKGMDLGEADLSILDEEKHKRGDF